MATLTIDVASSSGGLLDPLSIVGFNPQPEPPADYQYAFNPPAPGASESLALSVQLTGGSGPIGGTQISLTLQVLDDALVPLPTVPVAAITNVPAIPPFGLGLLALGLCGAGLLSHRARAGG
jgi:hypothetical protein